MRAYKYAAKLAAGDAKCAVVSVSVHDRHIRPNEVLYDNVFELSGTELKTVRVASDMRGLRLDRTVSTGHVAEEIVKIAESGGFDLIVMGAKGRSALCDPPMGSVAQKVLSETRLPVTVVK
jgi:nucleotide-binding universal stress UspA family protein